MLFSCLTTEGQTEDEAEGGCMANESLLDLDVEEKDHTMFHNIKYLSGVVIGQPKDEEVIQQQIKEANQKDRQAGNEKESSVLSVPRTSDGWVFLRGNRPSDQTQIQRFPICRIIFFARGNADSDEANCFAFTCVHTDVKGKNHGWTCLPVSQVNDTYISDL